MKKNISMPIIPSNLEKKLHESFLVQKTGSFVLLRAGINIYLIGKNGENTIHCGTIWKENDSWHGLNGDYYHSPTLVDLVACCLHCDKEEIHFLNHFK